MPCNRHWTEKEVQHLQEHFAYIPAAEIARLYPDRSARSVNCMAQRLGLRKGAARLSEMGMQNRIPKCERPTLSSPQPAA